MRLVKAESDRLNKAIRELYVKGWGCRRIAKQIGVSAVTVYKRVAKMGIMRTEEEQLRLRADTIPEQAVPFGAASSPMNLRSAAIGEAIRWFLSRGHIPSVPLEVTTYDLVVETPEGFVRVRVKTTTRKAPAGVWSAHVSHAPYDATVTANANGSRRKAYTQEEVDYLFILTGDNTKYVIPIEVLAGRKSLDLGVAYDKYRVD